MPLDRDQMRAYQAARRAKLKTESETPPVIDEPQPPEVVRDVRRGRMAIETPAYTMGKLIAAMSQAQRDRILTRMLKG